MTLHARKAGIWSTALPYVRSAGAWVIAKSVHARDAGAWKVVAEILSGVVVMNDGLKANGTPVTLSLAITGGYGTLTYAWSRTSFTAGSGNITGSATGATVNITGGTNADGEFTCIVTDTLTGGTVSGTGYITWGVGP